MRIKLILGFIGVLILMAPAFYNGFPLVYSDTGTYIQSGMELIVPKDRPVVYGLLIRLFSLNFSLWGILCFQSAILVFLLWEITKKITQSDNFNFTFYLIVLVILSACTGIGWYSSQIMPDIFTPIAILSAVLLLIENDYSFRKKIVIGGFLLIAIITHFSNFIIIGLLLFVVFILHKFNKDNFKLHYKVILFPLLLSIPVLSIINYSLEGSFKFSKNSSVFIMVKMLDSGVLKSFLDDYCDEENYVLCAFKDKLPEDSRSLLWEENSPLNRVGEWEKSAAEYNKIIVGILTSPKHLGMYIFSAMTSSCAQLLQNEIGSGLKSTWYSDENSPPHFFIKTHFPNELMPFKLSRQNGNLWKQGLDFTWINNINRFLLIISTIFLMMIYGVKEIRTTIDPKIRWIGLMLLLSVVINAIVIGSLVNVYDRLQARVSWVIVYLALIFLMLHWKQLIANLIQLSKSTYR